MADAPCIGLEWDSNFWRFPVARVEGDLMDHLKAREIDQWAMSNQIRCLYFLASCSDPLTVATTQQNGYSFVDIRVTLAMGLEQPEFPVKKFGSIRPGQPEDLEALKEIARSSHRDSRFFFDTNFDKEKCGTLYEFWIEKSLTSPKEEVLVAEHEGFPSAYITLETYGHEEPATIGLFGVSARARGRGLGRELLASALSHLSRQGVTKVEVVTQGRNIAAQRLYQGAGFRTKTMGLWYHKWFSPHVE